MTIRHEAQKTLPQLLRSYWVMMRDATGMKETTFAAAVREHYLATVPEHSQTVTWSHVVDTVGRMKRDAEKVSGWFSDDVSARLPVEVLEAIIAAFPPEWRFRLQCEINARQGLLAVPIPQVAHNADGANLGRMVKEAGEAMVAISAMLDDGQINRADRKRAPSAIKELDEAIAVMLEMRERIERQAMGNVTPIKERAHG